MPYEHLLQRRDTSMLLSTKSSNNHHSDDTTSVTESPLNTPPPTKRSNDEHRRMGELTQSEQVAYDILCELSKSEFSFRIVVVGKNGSAILESTVPCFGPKITVLQSPSTGTRCFCTELSFGHTLILEMNVLLNILSFFPRFDVQSTGANMATIANADQSFEYHVQLEQIYEIAFVEKETPNKTLRIVRFMNENGDSITSFILVDVSAEAQKWFTDLIQTHGDVLRLYSL
jgi:hypothetical protein